MLRCRNYEAAMEAHEKDQKVDADRDGVPDVKQLSNKELLQRKGLSVVEDHSAAFPSELLWHTLTTLGRGAGCACVDYACRRAGSRTQPWGCTGGSSHAHGAGGRAGSAAKHQTGGAGLGALPVPTGA
eukprot:scaffold565_cov358-Prasinococcus_capsulatus_cf.AAC.7